jgi:hypothetical protein
MATAAPDKEPSISQVLADMGYSHRKTAGEMGHAITHIATGDFVGFHHAHTAIEAAERHAAETQASLRTMAPLFRALAAQ